MKILTKYLYCGLLLHSSLVFAEETKVKLTEQQKKDAADKNECARVGGVYNFFVENERRFTGIASPMSAEAYKLAFDIVDGIANSTRADQTKMLDLARAINGFLFVLKENELTKNFKDQMYLETSKLSKQSRRDTLVMNQNISRLIRCEGPKLLEDIAKINLLLKEKPNAIYEINDRLDVFSNDLTQLTFKFTNSREFFIGIGASYAYFPKIISTSAFDFDLTPFDGTIGNDGAGTVVNSGIINTRSEFSNISYPSLRLTADMPILDIDLMIGSTEEKTTSTTAIRAEATGIEGRSILYKTNISSTLKLDYDVQARLSIRDTWDMIEDKLYGAENDDSYRTFFEDLTAQINFGVGVGTSGFSIENTIVTDYRFKEQNNLLFDDLEVQGTVEQDSDSSFNVFYWNVFATFEISDQFMASLEYRFYDDKTKDNNSLKVDGDMLSFSIVLFVF